MEQSPSREADSHSTSL